MTSAADISVAQVIAGQSPSDQLPETPPVTPDPYGLITPIDESVHVVKAIENLEPLPSAITTEASPVKVQGWTPINGKAILSNLPTPSSSSPSSDLTREDSPVIKDTSSATSSLVVSANSERNFQNETPSSRKRKADTQVTNDETARMTKRQRERSKGDKIIGEGCVATNPCTKCKNGGKTCKVPTNPKEMFTFKCGACIKGQMGCSLSARTRAVMTTIRLTFGSALKSWQSQRRRRRNKPSAPARHPTRRNKPTTALSLLRGKRRARHALTERRCLPVARRSLE